MNAPLPSSLRGAVRQTTHGRPTPRERTAGGQRGRVLFARAVFTLYLLAVLEGVLRKWAFPGIGQALYFLRDPVLLFAYLLATRYRLWPRPNLLFLAGAALAIAGVLVALAQQMVNGASLEGMLLAGYGWRNYFLYPPLAFVIARQLRGRDLEATIRWTLLLAIPIAVLVTIQFWAPLDSPVNIGFGTDKSDQFRGLTLTQDHTRPMGPFTSVLGQTLFVSSLFCFLLSQALLPRLRRPVGRGVLLCASAAFMTAFALGGSRTAVLHCGLILAATLILAFAHQGRGLRAKALILPVAVLVVTAVIYPLAFPEGFDAFMYRWTAADKLESASFSGGIIGRALYNFIDFARLLNDTPLLGYGLGFGGNASTTLGATIHGAIPLSIAETEWSRQIVDLGPVLGLVFIAYRIALTLWVGAIVLRATRMSNNPLPVLLFAFIGPELLYGLVTGHGTVNVYTWLFVGYTLAASRLATESCAPRRSQPGRARSVETTAGRRAVGDARERAP